ncbi:putative aquaporin TIP4-1 [Apostasia shenzhenica]|uniref:Putative aquaporin TIP4-1 n=1 Tax=Apostasia shenzhenica TaxID=1088818 RepID=A0A2H9ZZL5_9ASPA|nr:putative aquaporin TIP4-1 [Apostasia shenzhenica]
MVSKLAKWVDDAEPGCARAVAGELFLTFLFIFTSAGAAVAAGPFSFCFPPLCSSPPPSSKTHFTYHTERTKVAGDSMTGVVACALVNTLSVSTIVSAGTHISGAHLNPAVTLSMAAGGRIGLFRAALYVGAQLLASSLACLLLSFLSAGVATPVHVLAPGVGSFQGVGMEIVLTFSLLFTIYAIMVEPAKDFPVGLGPLLIGLLVGANTVVGGPFTGASMNPARSFGPALVTWNWASHWVYWAGPIIGGLLAGFMYERFLVVRPTYDALPCLAEVF